MQILQEKSENFRILRDRTKCENEAKWPRKMRNFRETILPFCCKPYLHLYPIISGPYTPSPSFFPDHVHLPPSRLSRATNPIPHPGLSCESELCARQILREILQFIPATQTIQTGQTI